MNEQERIPDQRHLGVENPTLPPVRVVPKAKPLDGIEVTVGHQDGKVIVEMTKADGTKEGFSLDPSRARRLAELIRQTSYKALKSKKK